MTIILISFPSYANELVEQQLPIICGPSKQIMEGIQRRFKEDGVFVAADKNSVQQDLYHTLMINPSTGTWTFAVVNQQAKTTCIIGSGTNANLIGFIGV